MTNREISAVFSAIGSLLQIRGDDAFRARIYDRAADIIENFPLELTAEPSEQDTSGYNKAAIEQLRATLGIGKAIQDKTVEMLETGRCKYYDDLTAEMGTGILELLELRGIGVKTVGRFYQELGVRNLEDLRALLESGKMRGMKGIGKKTLQMIAESLEFRTQLRKARPLWAVLPIAQRISENLAQFGWIKREPQFTGHLRRSEEICRGIELIVECEDETAFQFEKGVVPDALQAFLEPFSQTQIVFKTGDQAQYLYDSNSASFIEKSRNEPTGDVRDMLPVLQFYIDQDFPVFIYLCTAPTSELTLFLTTAAGAHFDALPDCPSPRTTEHGITEAEIYEELGLSYIPPELRQDGTSVAAAKDNTLPDLVEFTDLRGDLHAHTDWSDGRNTLQEMVEAAKAEGLDYFAITDHSVSSTVANGLDQKRLLEQVKQVRELDAEIEGMTVLAGSEVDIRRSGTLDFPDEILAQLDIVVASVHSHFNLTEAEMTKRIVRAIENPFVNIIGHPTGRMLGHRHGYPLNLEEVIAAAAENRTVLEINGSPSRLDLDPQFVRMAKKCRCTVSGQYRCTRYRTTGAPAIRLECCASRLVDKSRSHQYLYTVEELREQCGICLPS